MIEDEPLASHMGLALAYMRKAIGMVRQYTSQKDKQLKKMFSKNEINQLKTLDRQFSQLFAEADKKNKYVIKDVERQ